MGNHRISDDLKEAALCLQDDGHSTAYIKQIAGSISKSMLYCAQKRKHTTGSVVKAQAIGHSRPRSLLKTDADYLLHLAQHKPTLFLDKYTHCLELYWYLPVSLAMIHRTFECAGLCVKHVQKLASERDPILCADFVCRIGHYLTDYLAGWGLKRWANLSIVGKSGCWAMCRAAQPLCMWEEALYGCRAGTGRGYNCCSSCWWFVHKGNIHGVPLGWCGELFTYMYGSTSSHSLQLPLTTPYPGPQSVLIMDNAQIHHSPEIEDLVRGYGSFSH